MRFTQELGVVAATGDSLKAEKIEVMYVTTNAILVGQMAILSTSVTDGSKCSVATTALDHLILGLYEGVSQGRGAATTTTGATGYDAVAGETVWLTVFGQGVHLTYAAATNTDTGTIVVGEPVCWSITAGRGTRINSSAIAPGFVAPCIALESNTATATGGSATKVFVRFM